MTSKEEKKRRKDLVISVKESNRAEAERQLPMPKGDLSDLFDWVAIKLDEYECGGTLRYTLEFVKAKELPEDTVVDWLSQYGGHCDCEVLANVEGAWRRDDGGIEHVGW